MSYFGTVYARHDLSPRAKTVYMYLLDRANRAGQSWPAILTIAHDLSLSRSTVQRALNELERCGLLIREARWRENGGRSSNLYTLYEKTDFSAKEEVRPFTEPGYSPW